MNESPPPPPSGTSVREWFAGLALMNPTLMSGLSPCERAVEAVRLADELVRALVAPRTPSQESMSVPVEGVGLNQSWNDMAHNITSANKKSKQVKAQNRETQPDLQRRQTSGYDSNILRSSIPPPPPPRQTEPTIILSKAATHFKRASDVLDIAAKALLASDPILDAGRYSSFKKPNGET